MQLTDEGLVEKKDDEDMHHEGVKEGQKRSLPSWLAKKSKF